jgi:two-component system, cell cycle response regulator DivK
MPALLLLVEDNELNRDMLSRRLERKGYVILMAADGAQGVSMATELRPALVLMDLSLPVMDGWEAIRRLKADPETATIPIIALTAHARAEDETTARQAGANDFDTKPIDLNRLVTDRKLLFDVEEKERMRSHAKTQRRKGEKRIGRGKTMGQAIYFSPLNPLRLSVLSEAGVRNR